MTATVYPNIDAFGDVKGSPELLDKSFVYEVKDAPKQGTDDWLNWRKMGITATEAASIMFPSKWGSPLKIYTDKLGITKSDQSDPDGYMEWGHRIEDLLVAKFMEEHTDFTLPSQGRLYQRGWAKASLDAQAFNADGKPVIIECKTGQDIGKWDPIPDRYYAQVQWQMYVSGIRKAYFAVLIQGHTYFEREVDFCLPYVLQMLTECEHVWDCIQTRTTPAKLGDFDCDKEAIAGLAGMTGHTGSPVEVSREDVAKYFELKTKAENAEREFGDFKNAFGLKLIDNSKLVCEGRTFASWVERKGQVSIDTKLLQTKFPEAYEACKRVGLGTRYVRYATGK